MIRPVVVWLSDRREFERNLGEYAVILACIAIVLEAMIVGMHLLELVRAPRAVRFIE